jgi:hypothetical protein
MAKTKTEDPTPQTNASAELVAALVQAINATKPVEKKSAANRKPKTPWSSKDGSPKPKLKRKMYQHSLLIDEDMMHNDEIDLLNKLKPGRYLDGWVKVTRRRDRGVDIDYPIKTAAQRLKLVNQFGIRNLKELLERIVEEGNNPTKYAVQDLD